MVTSPRKTGIGIGDDPRLERSLGLDKSAFRNLKTGDIVKPIGDHRCFVVTSNYGDHVTAVATVDMTNPSEWDLVMKAKMEGVKT